MQTKNPIGGEWVGATDGREFEVCDPATDEVLARVPDGGAAETEQAIDAAAAAFPAWSAAEGPRPPSPDTTPATSGSRSSSGRRPVHDAVVTGGAHGELGADAALATVVHP